MQYILVLAKCFDIVNVILINAYTSGKYVLIHYVTKQTLIDDYIFSTAYYLTLQPDGHIPDMLPLYKYSVIDGNSTSDSRVATSFDVAQASTQDIARAYLDAV